jgi:RimJ/RimL family protein N-acetyltransferase
MNTGRIHLRAFEREDLDTVIRWVNDESVTCTLSDAFIYPVSRSDEMKWLENVALANYREKVFAIEKEDGVLIGSVGLHQINWVERKAELGILIGEKQCWGKGYGREAIQAVLHIAFKKMNLHRVYLRVFEFHQRAIGLYEHCGFQREGLLREDHYYGGKYSNTLIMGLLKQDYLTRSPEDRGFGGELPPI